MNEQYLEDLYCIEEGLQKTISEFAKKVKKADRLDESMLKYSDTLMHLAKNLEKTICFEEGMGEDEMEQQFSGSRGGTQAQGRAIRSTPGMWSEESGESMRGSSMRGGSSRGSSRGGDGGGYSSRRGSRGRYTSANGSSGGGSYDGGSYNGGSYGGSYNDGFSGHDDQEGTIEKLRKWADATTNHDEREIMLNMIERLRNEG